LRRNTQSYSPHPQRKEKMAAEEWRPVVGYEGHFEVSSLGRVRSVKHKPYKVFKLQPLRTEYLQVCLSKGNVRRSKSVHQLVAQAFIPNPENKPQINHKNGIPSDNRVGNLEWATAYENMQHAWKTKLIDNFGERNPLAKLNTEKVRLIRILQHTIDRPTLARLFGVDISNIGYVVKGITWKHV